MKRLILIALLLTVWVAPLAAQDQKIDHRLLVERDGLMYKKFSDTPFTGATQEKNRIYREYNSGRLQGQKLEFYRNGQLKAKSTWQNGKLDGPYREYYENGKIKIRGVSADDKRTGIWTAYHENGTKAEQARYEDKGQNSEYVGWHENGRKRAEGIMINGVEDGEWRFWFEDGRPDKNQTGMYQDGEKIW